LEDRWRGSARHRPRSSRGRATPARAARPARARPMMLLGTRGRTNATAVSHTRSSLRGWGRHSPRGSATWGARSAWCAPNVTGRRRMRLNTSQLSVLLMWALASSSGDRIVGWCCCCHRCCQLRASLVSLIRRRGEDVADALIPSARPTAPRQAVTMSASVTSTAVPIQAPSYQEGSAETLLGRSVCAAGRNVSQVLMW
jgi:hypothetical protein